MKEKLKILQNEVEILRNESVAKDKALSKEHLERGNGFYARDALRAETNKAMAAVKDEEVQVSQLVAEIDNLNSLINGIEKEMLKLKQRYAACLPPALSAAATSTATTSPSPSTTTSTSTATSFFSPY